MTRAEIEQLRTRFKDLNIERVWRNASKRALICDSVNTVQARTAHIGYSAVGRNIIWAVLDTGIRAAHPHFRAYHNVLRLAPGERILPAYHAYSKEKKENLLSTDDLYVEMSGTSMAAPHVSGILAAFLSVRREFIGYPDLLKTLLLESCTDMDRDRYIQGYGLPSLPNLIKMLVSS